MLPSTARCCFGVAAEQSHQRNNGNNGLRTLWFGGFLFAFLPGKTARLFPSAPTGRYGGVLGGTGIIGPCGNNSQFGSPEGRFRAGETELKPRAQFKASSVAFSQVNKREYRNTKIGFRSFGNPECRRITPRILPYLGTQLFPNGFLKR